MAEFQAPGVAGLARFTGGGIAARQERMPAPLRELHRAVLRRFLEAGAPPTERWLRRAAAEAGLDAPAVDELATADAVHVVSGVVAVAYPFSGTPTPHRVELDGLPVMYAMCAIDALGLPLMAGRDGRVTSADPADGAPIEVTVRGGAWSWVPAGTVVVAGRATDCGGCGSFEVMCPNTAFHASAGSARAWLAGHGGLDAEILDQDIAIECGRLNFASLLTGPAWRLGTAGRTGHGSAAIAGTWPGVMMRVRVEGAPGSAGRTESASASSLLSYECRLLGAPAADHEALARR